MKSQTNKSLCIGVFAAMVLCVFVPMGVADFSRYQIIIDRRPFGEPPAVAEEPAAPSRPSGPSYFERVRLVAITTSRGGTRVGFVDNNVTPARTYFLFVGDAEDQFRVLSADYEMETALLERDGERRTLRIGGGIVTQASTMPGPRRTVSDGSRAVTHDVRDAVRQGNYIAPRITPGRQQRLEEEKRRRESSQYDSLPRPVLMMHLQRVNEHAIRTGAPPLPIPLTPEQDQRLVEDGFLQPSE